MSIPPDKILLSLDSIVPCRELQVRQLASLLSASNPSTLVVHGVGATAKSSIVGTLLDAIETPSAIVRSQECITTRHMLERAVSLVNDKLNRGNAANGISVGRCDSISAFVVELQRILGEEKFILVFDGIDRQREAAPTLFPAVGRLGELIPTLTTILITTTSNPYIYHHSSLPHVHFPPYSRPEVLSILSKTPLSIYDHSPSHPSDDEAQQTSNLDNSTWLWARFTAAVWDSLGQSVARDIVTFREVCSRLWPQFIQPIRDGHYGAREFSKLLVRNRSLLQNEAALVDNIVSIKSQTSEVNALRTPSRSLPYYPAHLLIAAYLASHNPARHDITLFSKTSLSKRRKRGGGTALTPSRPSKHRKISRKLLGPQAFPLERLMAIFHAILPHKLTREGGDIMCMIATLVGLRLVVKAGVGVDVLEGGAKWRCNVGWDFVNNVSRDVKFDIENYIID